MEDLPFQPGDFSLVPAAANNDGSVPLGLVGVPVVVLKTISYATGCCALADIGCPCSILTGPFQQDIDASVGPFFAQVLDLEAFNDCHLQCHGICDVQADQR